jgi:hypothetical protein
VSYDVINKKTKWSFRRKTHKCTECRTDINQPWWYEVFDSKGNSKGPHHLACAERVIKGYARRNS